MKYPLVKLWFLKCPKEYLSIISLLIKSLLEIFKGSLLDIVNKRIFNFLHHQKKSLMTFDCVLYKMVTARMICQNKRWSIQNMFCFHLLSSISKKSDCIIFFGTLKSKYTQIWNCPKISAVNKKLKIFVISSIID